MNFKFDTVKNSSPPAGHISSEQTFLIWNAVYAPAAGDKVKAQTCSDRSNGNLGKSTAFAEMFDYKTFTNTQRSYILAI